MKLNKQKILDIQRESYTGLNMADGSASSGGLESSVTLSTKEVSSAKGLVGRCNEAERRFQETQREVREEFDLQVGQFSEWARRQMSQRPDLVRSSHPTKPEEDGLLESAVHVSYSVTVMDGVWAVEGGGKKEVFVSFGADREGEEAHLSKLEISDLEDEGKGDNFTLDSDSLTIASDGLYRRLHFRESGEIGYEQDTKGQDILVPDILDTSRKVLDFLGKATMQPAVPPAQPASGQPTA